MKGEEEEEEMRDFYLFTTTPEEERRKRRKEKNRRVVSALGRIHSWTVWKPMRSVRSCLEKFCRAKNWKPTTANTTAEEERGGIERGTRGEKRG